MYKIPKFQRSQIKRAEKIQGETLEQKVRRITVNKEPIEEGAPTIYTERKDGVLPAYDVRTDRWEIAAEAMDKVHKSSIAARDGIADMKVIKGGEDGKAEPAQGSGTEEQYLVKRGVKPPTTYSKEYACALIYQVIR